MADTDGTIRLNVAQCEGCERPYIAGGTCPACHDTYTCLRCGWCESCAGFTSTQQGTGPRDCPCPENQLYGTCGH